MEELLCKAFSLHWSKVKQPRGTLEAFRNEKWYFSKFWIQAENADGLDDGAEPQAPKDWWALCQIASSASSWPQPREKHSHSNPQNYFGTRPLWLWSLQATSSALKKMTVFPKIKINISCPHPIREVWALVDLKGLIRIFSLCLAPQDLSSAWVSMRKYLPKTLFFPSLSTLDHPTASLLPSHGLPIFPPLFVQIPGSTGYGISKWD